MEAKHTPGPWSARFDDAITIRDAHDNQLAICTHIKTKTGNRRDTNEVEATAKFIVRACNAHDDLLKALQDILNAKWTAAGISEAHADAARAALVKAGAA